MDKLIVDFVFPDCGAEPTLLTENGPLLRRAMRCNCGSESFSIANVLQADEIKGIPASCMYECSSCGNYQLG